MVPHFDFSQSSDMSLLNCKNLQYSISDRALLEDASLQVEKGERIGLLGRNGEGKSTLLRILSGALRPDGGEVVGDGPVRITELPQDVPEDVRGTVMSVIASGLASDETGDHPVERLGSLLGLELDQSFADLSGGQKRRALLGRALAGEPDVLLLDEPTNHLDLDGILWIETFLRRFDGSVIFVTHDRAFLQRLATRIVELDRGRLRSWACDYATYRQRKAEFLVAEEKQWAQFDKKLAQEEAWIRQGIKARRTRDEGRVRALERLREERSQRRARVGQANIRLQSAERSGQKVIDAKKISFAYPSATDTPVPVVHEFTATIMRGDKVGIIGPNGCGKTTLLNLLLGRLAPQAGTVQNGTSLQVSYFDQHRDELESERSVFDNIADGNDKVTIDGVPRHVIGYLSEFLFSPDRARMPVKHLSGGERCRLLLARLFTRPSNVLVMDEPTNDLDTETLELLETRLLEYPGTLLLVSHDRQFLDNLCTSSLVFEGAGRISEYVGGYTDWQNAVARPRKIAKSTEGAARTKTAVRPQKLNNKEREEFKRLPAHIEALEREEEALQSAMSDAEFYRGAAETVKAASERIHVLSREIEAAYTRWSELEERA